MKFDPRKYMHQVHHIGFVVKDIDCSIGFYQNVLGFKLHNRWSESSDMVRDGMGIPGASLELAQMKGYGCMLEFVRYVTMEGADNRIEPNRIGVGHISFSVQRFSEFLDRLKKAGVQTVSPAVKLNSGQWVQFLDPDGVRIEIMGHLDSAFEMEQDGTI